jgi:hypothetical protein
MVHSFYGKYARSLKNSQFYLAISQRFQQPKNL